jgi:RPA family protein
MPEQNQYKRNIAFKLRIGDILIGKPIFEQEKFKYLELGSKNVARVNVVGNIVERYDSEGEKKYSFFKLDDGSGQISLKVFGDDVEKFKSVEQGLTVTIIGFVRNWNNETYITPEMIKEQDPKYLLIRKLENEKERNNEAAPIEDKAEFTAVKDKILATIKSAEEEGGIEMDKIIINLQDLSPEIINQEVQKLLEEGIVFEPRPGKVRYLG